MTAILYRAPAGVAGDVTRPDVTIVEPALMNPENPVTAFGVPVQVTDGKIEPLGEGTVYGILTRVAPAEAGDLAQGFDDGTPNPVQVQGVAVKGYVCVKCTAGTPARGGAVYVGTDGLAADSGTALGGWIWATDGTDENGLAEIRIG